MSIRASAVKPLSRFLQTERTAQLSMLFLRKAAKYLPRPGLRKRGSPSAQRDIRLYKFIHSLSTFKLIEYKILNLEIKNFEIFVSYFSTSWFGVI